MYLEELSIKGYKLFNEEFKIKLNTGLTVLAGENSSGKSAVIDAIRLLLVEDEYRLGISTADFHRNIKKPAREKGVDQFYIRCTFQDLSEKEQIAYLPWLNAEDSHQAIINLQVENKEDSYGRFKRTLWGGDSVSSIFEWELLRTISCIYLPPLRDAEDKLRDYRGSRLARLLKNLKQEIPEGEDHPLEKKVTEFNKSLLKEDTINIANKSIKRYLMETIGPVFSQDTSIQFSEVKFDRIVESLKLLFYPLIPQEGKDTEQKMFRELNENSLGYNNLLYLSTILAELEGLKGSKILHKILLIEEPEAHLHPQLQIRLLRYLQNKSRESDIQVIVTTHSPTIAASVKLDMINVLSISKIGETPYCVSLSNCGLTDNGKFFLERWLDITKSTLLFARSILLVEGIVEGLLLPELANIVIKERNTKDGTSKEEMQCLADYGVSIINMGGIYFDHFFQLFKGYQVKNNKYTEVSHINIRCAGITDCDPAPQTKPTSTDQCECKNSKFYLVDELKAHSKNCRLFYNLKTFEYDLAMTDNNLTPMYEVFLKTIDTNGPTKEQVEKYLATDWGTKNEIEKSEAAYWLYDHIKDNKKGMYAQLLAYELSCQNINLSVPTYIKEAVLWILGNL
ncbi:MAG: ATP-dependent nuclease [Candidatus Humimicrobiaceae bacterium]